jgi:leucyl/phenylalanyl-tRNA--protein transferase
MGIGDRGTEPIGWWSPDPRGILRLPDLRVSRSLRKSLRRFEIRVDTAFGEVVRACAAPDRDGRWITPEITAAYTGLHEAGWAHSVETWRDGRLVGGLYGVAIGGLFAGESMFHAERDASKAALVGLHAILSEDDDPRRLIDVQWQTPHLATLGVTEVSRDTYRALLAEALRAPLPARWA